MLLQDFFFPFSISPCSYNPAPASIFQYQPQWHFLFILTQGMYPLAFSGAANNFRGLGRSSLPPSLRAHLHDGGLHVWSSLYGIFHQQQRHVRRRSVDCFSGCARARAHTHTHATHARTRATHARKHAHTHTHTHTHLSGLEKETHLLGSLR